MILPPVFLKNSALGSDNTVKSNLVDLIYDLTINEQSFNGVISGDSLKTITIFIKDKNQILNLHQPKYQLNVTLDTPPDLIINKPNKLFELDEIHKMNTNI